MPSSKKTSTKTATPAPVFTQPCAAAACEVACEAAPCEAACEVVTPCEESTPCEAATTPLASGRVKWFNNKAGYGFITVVDCETNEERDMFVHHSEIKVDQSQYKYLIQGEYVEFVIGAIHRENNIDVHATNVRGINGGKLMCETRNEVRSYRTTQTTPQQSQGQQSQGQQSQGQQSQGQQSQGQQAQRQQSHGQRQQRPGQQTQGEQRQTQAQQTQGEQRQTQTQPRQKDRRPQLAQEDQSEWMVVPRRRTDTVQAKQRNTPRQRQPDIEVTH